ncbi:hypothetical protein [Pandoraea communis]|uniref:hypothetical protein n=1 Tax=Pandoraea communis TaxID=2508297 RepID=UPI0025A5AF0E|nr:hypothetical protein [Pandoraea communis]MDM8356180.1 hypothetical protein [Pandoraea communis]
MHRKKKLKTNGSRIVNYSISIKKVKSNYTDNYVDSLFLEITTDEGTFNYEIRSDEKFPDLDWIKSHIDVSLGKAQADFLNVEISEYADRGYLFFVVQDIGQHQYSGLRI